MAIIGHVSIAKAPNGALLDDQIKRYKQKIPPFYDGRGADGYGRKIATRHMLMLRNETHWRRVYVCQISNAGTAYVEIDGDWIVVEDWSQPKPLTSGLHGDHAGWRNERW